LMTSSSAPVASVVPLGEKATARAGSVKRVASPLKSPLGKLNNCGRGTEGR
jgi:hypothetical protein